MYKYVAASIWWFAIHGFQHLAAGSQKICAPKRTDIKICRKETLSLLSDYFEVYYWFFRKPSFFPLSSSLHLISVRCLTPKAFLSTLNFPAFYGRPPRHSIDQHIPFVFIIVCGQLEYINSAIVTSNRFFLKLLWTKIKGLATNTESLAALRFRKERD